LAISLRTLRLKAYENYREKILTAKDAKKGREGREETTGSKDDFSLSPKG
jgi:hypothetical protein